MTLKINRTAIIYVFIDTLAGADEDLPQAQIPAQLVHQPQDVLLSKYVHSFCCVGLVKAFQKGLPQLWLSFWVGQFTTCC